MSSSVEHAVLFGASVDPIAPRAETSILAPIPAQSDQTQELRGAGDLATWRATPQDRLLPAVEHAASRFFEFIDQFSKEVVRTHGQFVTHHSGAPDPTRSLALSRTLTGAGARLRRLPRGTQRTNQLAQDHVADVLADLDRSVASLKLAEIQNHRLERDVEMLRREFARLYSAKRGSDLDMLEARRATKELEHRLAKVRQTISWQLGSALVDSAQSVRGALQLPARLHKVFKSSRHLRRRGELASKAVPRNMVGSAETVHLASAAIKVMAAQDARQAAVWARSQSPKPAILAHALIEIAIAIGRDDPALAASLGAEAIELTPVEGRIKHLAFQLGDYGHVTAAVSLVDKATVAGAKLNISEMKKVEGLRALHRLTLSPPTILRHEVTARRIAGPRIAFVGRDAVPFQCTTAALRLYDRAVLAERHGLRATIIAMPGTGVSPSVAAKSVGAGKGGRTKVGAIDVVMPAHSECPPEVVDLYMSSAAASIASTVIQEGAAVIRADAFYTSGVAAAMAARSIGCPLVVDVDDLLDPHEPFYVGFERTEKAQIQLRMTVQTACAADLCVVSSPRMMKLLLGVGVPANRIVHAAHRYPSIEMDRGETVAFSRGLGVGDGPVIGVVRDLCTSYDSRVLGDVLARLVQEFSSIKLLVVGAGRAADELRRRVAEHNLGHALILVESPRPEDVARYRALLDVALFTRNDTTKSALVQPYELLASMAQSRASVAFRTIDAAENIENGVSGLLCRPGDADEMAGAVASLLRDPDLRRSIGARAASAYHRAVGHDSAPRQLADLYAGLLADHA